MVDPVNPAHRPHRRLEVLPDGETLARRAARLIGTMLREAIAVRGRASFALAGGNTPRLTYSELASLELQWAAVDFVWGDERMVAPDHEASNVRMAREALLDPLGIEAKHIHAPDVTLGSPQTARVYERVLRALDPREDPPRLDVVLLGMGSDGHTASLFPGGDELDVPASSLVVHSVAPVEPTARVSMTLPLLQAARNVVFLVSGPDKRKVLRRVLRGDTQLPAARVRPARGELVWLVDEQAFPEDEA